MSDIFGHINTGKKEGSASLVCLDGDTLPIRYKMSPLGLYLSSLKEDIPLKPINVSIIKIKRIQKLVKDFRMPESIGLRWWRMQDKLTIKRFNIYEIPKWAPGKFWLRLIADEWCVKGSPEKSTFMTVEDEFTESLSQDELEQMAKEAGVVRLQGFWDRWLR